jgi:hypothetical protein
MTDKRLAEFRTQCFWSAMRHRIVFCHRASDLSHSLQSCGRPFRFPFFNQGNREERCGNDGKGKDDESIDKKASIKCMKAASIRGQQSPRAKEFLLIRHSKLAIRVA